MDILHFCVHVVVQRCYIKGGKVREKGDIQVSQVLVTIVQERERDKPAAFSHLFRENYCIAVNRNNYICNPFLIHTILKVHKNRP